LWKIGLFRLATVDHPLEVDIFRYLSSLNVNPHHRTPVNFTGQKQTLSPNNHQIRSPAIDIPEVQTVSGRGVSLI
jgi:hypothetical protein